MLIDNHFPPCYASSVGLDIFSRNKQPQPKPYSPRAEAVRTHFYAKDGETDKNIDFHREFDTFPDGPERRRLCTELAVFSARERGDADQVSIFAMAGIEPVAIPEIRAHLQTAISRKRVAERPAS